MENETNVEPLFEFEAPKYVDLRYAASEEGFNDGADEWFDQIGKKTSPGSGNQFSLQGSENRRSEERKAHMEISSQGQGTSSKLGTHDNMVTARTPQLQHKDVAVSNCEGPKQLKKTNQKTPGADSKQILTETTNQIDVTSIKDQNTPRRQKCISRGIQSNSFKLHSSENSSRMPGSRVNEMKYESDSLHQKNKLRTGPLEKNWEVGKNMVAKRVPIEHSQKKDNEKVDAKFPSETKVLSSKTTDCLSHITAHHRNNKVAEIQRSMRNKRVSESRMTQPQTPKFLTDQRALRYRERLEKLREQSKPLIEPKTPKEFGLTWKPVVTRAKTPHFRSDSRLRHCVEKALNERQKQNEPSRTTQQIPKVVTFGQHTARRAEMYKQQKSILSQEEIELLRIEQERKLLRETIMKSRENFQRALDAPNIATNSVQIRKSTVPREFHFHSKGRSYRSNLSESQQISFSSCIGKRPSRNL